MGQHHSKSETDAREAFDRVDTNKDGRISYEDLQKLSMRDLKSITKLLEKAGDAEDDEDEFPND